eukprot:XP_014057801.1 PREDICTED: monocarboxylate transporter 4-like [Salmo salar]
MGGVVVDEGPGGVKAPDGGWGWAVLSGCFVITGFSYAFPKAVSVFFKELIREFEVGYSDTAWISSILLAMLYGTGPLCSVLVNRYGCRPVMMVGGLFASLGMILSSFSTSIIHIYLSTGVITGLGLALNFQPSLIMLNRYFSEKRPLANGLAAAGSPVALCCLSPLGQLLQYQYGWRGGFLILGGLLLNCCACAALMRPLVAPPKSTQLELEDVEKEGKELEVEKTPSKRKPLLDFSVFKDRGFLIYTIAASIMNTIWFPCPLQAKDYPSLVVFCVFFGISYGMVGALQFEVLMAIVGTEKFSSAIGLVLLMEAIAVLVGPPGAGRLLDATKNYMYVFLLAGIEVVLAAVVLATCNFLFIRKKPAEPAAELENGTVSAEMELLNKPVAAEEEEEVEKGEKEVKEMEEEKEKEEVKEMKEKEEKEKEEVKEMEEAVEKAKEDEEDSEKKKEEEKEKEIRPESVMGVSEEVERFLKEPEEQNGAVLSSSETRL